MKRSETRILTALVGSMPRPDGLVEMLGAVGALANSSALPLSPVKLTRRLMAFPFSSSARV